MNDLFVFMMNIFFMGFLAGLPLGALIGYVMKERQGVTLTINKINERKKKRGSDDE